MKLILALNGVKIRRVIGASDQGSAGDEFETLAARNLAIEGKSLRVDVFDDRQVLRGRAEVLSHRQHLHPNAAEVIKRFEELVFCFAESQHYATLGHDFGSDGLGQSQDLEGEAVFGTRPDKRR